MELRRFTMSNPTASFSIIAHEAWGHRLSVVDNDEDANFEDGHNKTQRLRSRLKTNHSNLGKLALVFR
ncbi:unnamed protein product [Rotaria magnacalcarata]|uniref:Uncharacterized protein n=1 Tax=Rotaria magnacalcarata TaxID=392030 RepID=A0A816XQ15_9BILA|nr:unnamed protein product [Rotaria magnacalcarata]